MTMFNPDMSIECNETS